MTGCRVLVRSDVGGLGWRTRMCAQLRGVAKAAGSLCALPTTAVYMRTGSGLGLVLRQLWRLSSNRRRQTLPGLRTSSLSPDVPRKKEPRSSGLWTQSPCGGRARPRAGGGAAVATLQLPSKPGRRNHATFQLEVSSTTKQPHPPAQSHPGINSELQWHQKRLAPPCPNTNQQ